TFYRSFESKDQLIAQCLMKHIDTTRAVLDAIAERFHDDPLAQLQAIVRSYADTIGAPDFRGCPVDNAAVEFPDPTHPIRGLVEDAKAELRGRLGGLTSRLAVDQPDLLADGLVLLLEGASTVRHTSGSQGPACALIGAADALLSAFVKR